MLASQLRSERSPRRSDSCRLIQYTSRGLPASPLGFEPKARRFDSCLVFHLKACSGGIARPHGNYQSAGRGTPQASCAGSPHRSSAPRSVPRPISRAYDWIRHELAAKRVKPRELVTLTLQYGDIGTIRRIAALLEIEGVEASLLRKLETALPSSSRMIPWIPTRPKRGTVNAR